MFEMSVKSVPGCLTLIAPSAIGGPVALTPGLGPQDDVSVLPPAAALLVVAAGALELELAAALELLLLLLPHPASATSANAASSASPTRMRGTASLMLTGSPLLRVTCRTS